MQIGQKRTRVDGPCVNRRGLLAASFKNRTEEQRDTSGTHLNRTAVEPVRFETLTRTAAYTQHGTAAPGGIWGSESAASLHSVSRSLCSSV